MKPAKNAKIGTPASKGSTEWQPGAGILEAANNVTLQGNVQAIGRDLNTYYVHNYAPGDPMAILRNQCEIEATQDSEMAAYAPRCKPGTRLNVLGEIMGWVHGNRNAYPGLTTTSLLWLSGPAGGGKTCIQREVAERCRKAGKLAASYFFSSRAPGFQLDISRPFVATIALQICSSIPGLLVPINQAIVKDRHIFDKSLEYQFEQLISRPLDAYVESSEEGPNWLVRKMFCIPEPEPPPKLKETIDTKVIVVDGLDECRDPREQIRIIRLLWSAITKYSLPFKIVIASRPEYDIRSTFSDKDIEIYTHRLRLEDYGCDTDIEDYLTDTLFGIRNKHPSGSTIPAGWPKREDIQQIVFKASGQFIYASTFLNFVQNPRRNITETFAFAMRFNHSPTGLENPYSELDALYSVILESAVTNKDLMLRLLHALVVLTPISCEYINKSELTTDVLDELFFLNPGTTAATFCDLHSILQFVQRVPDHVSLIRFHHRSFEDYLIAEMRSGKFYRPKTKTYRDLLILSNNHLTNWVYGDPDSIDYEMTLSHWILDWTTYANYLLRYDPNELDDVSADIVQLPEATLKYSLRMDWDYKEFSSTTESLFARQRTMRAGVHGRLEARVCNPFCETLTRVCGIIERVARNADLRSALHWRDRYHPTRREALYERIDYLMTLSDAKWEAYHTVDAASWIEANVNWACRPDARVY
ncbi:hypothetical protein FA15DRAFT_500767 [Coprinopsis marcescibilis]|uniref:Nephrocystin 3-like N-terminal domain-containing protein n=1 Tax=Coprinopsis marcescibilis TaxID=230819 RepID=A0A5C3KR06_COPMA|nr:hypothetical protein FA15DRAFT_500767 [Coprinopsis marcescibilis]